MADQFNVRFCLETGWPSGRKKRPEEAILTGMEWECFLSLPYLPRKDDMLKALQDDDFRRVEQVFLYAADDPYKVEVFFEFEESVRHAAMIEAGWREVR